MAAADLATPFLKGVATHTLACSDSAGRIARAAGVQRLVLTHFREGTGARLPAIEADVRTDFAGPASIAADLDAFLV
jgi:ribonuclease Z